MGNISNAIMISRERKLDTYRTLLDVLSDMVMRKQRITIYAVVKKSGLSRSYFYDNDLAHKLLLELRDTNGDQNHQREILKRYRAIVGQLEVEYDIKWKQCTVIASRRK